MDGDLFHSAGIELALEAEPNAWKGRYSIICTLWFLDMPAGTVFNGEVMRLHAMREGLGHPHHPNVWGAMAAHFLGTLFREGRIERHGVEKAVSAKAHARRYPSYRKV